MLFVFFFFPPSVHLSSALLGLDGCRPRTGELGEVGRSNDPAKYFIRCSPSRLHLLVFLPMGKVGAGYMTHISPQ